MVETGLETFLRDEPALTRTARIGLVVHPASVDRGYRHAAGLVSEKLGSRLVALFGPQHGARGEKQDNMIESEDYQDPRTGLLVHSLYGAVRKPTEEMLEGIDALVFDLQDIGARVYTFIWTMLLAMEACAELGRRFVVLDRPNPIGGVDVEGRCLEPQLRSFVGLHPIPMRHGMTTGELAQLFNEEFGIGAELHVVPLRGWRRQMHFEETGLPWVPPSPNVPTRQTPWPYPGTVLLEGTNLSEGRGTTRPLELLGAPYLDPLTVDAIVESISAKGAVLRPCSFEPAFHKWKGRLCHGVHIHVTERRRFRPLRLVVDLLREIRSRCPESFDWRPPPYEYEFERLPVDLIAGTELVRRCVDAEVPPEQLESAFREDEESWLELRRPHLLYP